MFKHLFPWHRQVLPSHNDDKSMAANRCCGAEERIGVARPSAAAGCSLHAGTIPRQGPQRCQRCLRPPPFLADNCERKSHPSVQRDRCIPWSLTARLGLAEGRSGGGRGPTGPGLTGRTARQRFAMGRQLIRTTLCPLLTFDLYRETNTAALFSNSATARLFSLPRAQNTFDHRSFVDYHRHSDLILQPAETASSLKTQFRRAW